MCMETVIGVQPKYIWLIWFFQVLKVECAFIHVEISLLLLVLRIYTFEVD